MTSPPDSRPLRLRAPPALLIGFGLFVVLIVYLVAASLTRKATLTFSPTPQTGAGAPGTPARPDTLTIDARDTDRWIYVDLDRGLPLPSGDSTGWDIAVRRYRLRAFGPSVTVRSASFPTTGAAVAAMRTAHPGRPAAELDRWYTYSMLSHLLEPDGRIHLVQTNTGATAAIQVLGYYCPGLTAGCLTLRYAVVSPNGSSSGALGSRSLSIWLAG